MNKEKIWRILFTLLVVGIIFLFFVSFQRINRDTIQEKKELYGNLQGENVVQSEVYKNKIDSLITDDVQGVIGSKDSHDSKTLQYLITLGTGLLIGGASFCFGSFTGFLFGIPRIINSTSASSVLSPSRSMILQNDNLVQISDWLTKIIVGVGLTQINSLPDKLWELGLALSSCFGPSDRDKVGASIAICVVIYFLILGFIASYLWTRIYFSEMLEKVAYGEEIIKNEKSL